MKLCPQLIARLDQTAQKYRDDSFLAIRHDDKVFVTNWIFGLQFPSKELRNSMALRRLEQRTDELARDKENYKEVIYYIYKRGWIDILVGTGMYHGACLVRNNNKEKSVFKDREWNVMSFETNNGVRYYVREHYFDIAEDVIGNGICPIIFRPVNSVTTPSDYRPMLFLDEEGDVRGMVYAITERNLRNPIDKTREYRRYLETQTPELFGNTQATRRTT